MAFETGLESKPWYVGALIGLLLGAVAYVGIYKFKLEDMESRITSQQSKLETLQQKITEGRAAQRELPKFREEVRQLELQLTKLLRILPARKNTPDLLRRIRNLTELGDLRLVSLKPGAFRDRDFFSEWPIWMKLEGSYHNLALFFDRLSRLSRIINIADMSVKAAKEEDPTKTISADFSAVTFVYKDEAEVSDSEESL